MYKTYIGLPSDYCRTHTFSNLSYPGMETQADRLRKARAEAGLNSPTEAIERFGWVKNTYPHNENGNATFSMKKANKYGEAYGVRGEWLYDGTPPMRSSKPVHRPAITIPVISWVSAGGLADPGADLPPETETIEISGLGVGSFFATRVEGTSMDRVAPDGAIIIVDQEDRDLVDGRPYLFRLKNETTFKFWHADPDRLEPSSTFPEHKAIFPRKNASWDVIGRVRRSIYDL